MNKFFIRRWVGAFLIFIFVSIDAQVTGDLKVAFIRVSFPVQDYAGVSGNGDFLYDSNLIVCGDYTIDPPPHDKKYFQSHLVAVNNYYRSISYGKFGLDLENSTVYPIDNQSAYKLQVPMNYYNEIDKDSDHEKRITELLKDALNSAYEIDRINFDHYDLIVIAHPGVGQDFKLPFLDPTPEDIPSTFIDIKMINTHLGGPITIGNATVSQAVIIPETQNHLYYDESIFSQLSNPCDVQYSITGTLAMMIGFGVGLPPLWDIQSGHSGVGVFALMDQGSNNGRGIIPAPPDAWTSIYAGWSTTLIIPSFSKVELINNTQNQIAKIPISQDEYFLIENRSNWFREGVSIDSARYVVWEKTNTYPEFINVLIDSVGVKKNEYGVITDIPNYNLGLPASGLLIWHIDEQKIHEGMGSFSINSDRNRRGIDLEEADGAQDIGYVSNLFTDPSSGYWGDMWFPDNQEYYRANADGHMNFSTFSYPNTKSNSGANSGIKINKISKVGEKMSFEYSSSYNVSSINDINKSIIFQWDLDNDGDLDFLGEGDSLWWSDDLNNINSFYRTTKDNYQICVAQNSDPVALAVLSESENNYLFEWFEFDHITKDFVLKWMNKKENFESIKLLKADGDKEQILVQYKKSFFKVDKKEMIEIDVKENDFPYQSKFGPSTIFYNDRIEINESSIHYGNYKSITLIDLENDGQTEIIALDTEGNIHAFDQNLYSKSGFPISTSAIGTILAMDLLGDDDRELIYQREDGAISILSSNGDEIDQIMLDNQLVGLGSYSGKHVIITQKMLIFFKDDLDGETNEWNYTYSTSDHSRYLNTKPPSEQQFIINWDQTYAYPNPAYGNQIVFRIEISMAELVEINIFDIAGFRVKSLNQKTIISKVSLADEIAPSISGVIEIPWDVSKIESGVYLAKIVVTNKGKSESKIVKVGVIK